MSNIPCHNLFDFAVLNCPGVEEPGAISTQHTKHNLLVDGHEVLPCQDGPYRRIRSFISVPSGVRAVFSGGQGQRHKTCPCWTVC